MQELISGEDDIKLENDNWNEAFFSELGPAAKILTTDENEDSIELFSEEGDIVEVEHTTIVNSYSDAIQAFEDVCQYFEQKGHTDEATTVSSFVSTVVDLSYKASASCR